MKYVISAQLLPYANPVASTGLRFMLAGLLMLPCLLLFGDLDPSAME